MPIPRSQLRMTPTELEAFLQSERTVRIATVSPEGEPHVAPLWFVWQDGRMYLNSLKRSRRTRDIERGSRVAACVDAGEEYVELRGVVLYGSFEDAGDVPEIRRAFGEKYWHGADIPETRSHRWLVMEPDKVVSWDFAKIPSGRDRRLQAQQQQQQSEG
jgi:nitroimidazol reductase NimA-like FMN-containing flavoprotein (pyridoxamine 5'-phosphate oxidase superfamily)